MRRFWVPLLVLGAAGFDPVGAFTFVGAAALGAARRNLALLALTSVLTTWVFSMAAVLGLGDAIHSLLQHVHLHPTHQQTSWALLVGGAILLGWGIVRVVRMLVARPDVASNVAPDAGKHREGRTPRSLNASGMATAGLLVGITTLVDPAWYAMVAFASTLDSTTKSIIAGTAWTAMSHVLLIILGLSLLFGWYEALDRLLVLARTRWQRPISLAISALLLAGGLAGIVWGLARLLHA